MLWRMRITNWVEVLQKMRKAEQPEMSLKQSRAYNDWDCCKEAQY